jgi:hypothetical protein
MELIKMRIRKGKVEKAKKKSKVVKQSNNEFDLKKETGAWD